MALDLKNVTKEQLLREIKKGGRCIVYSYCISVLILTFKRSSSVHFVPSNSSPVTAGLPWVLLTVLLGWWGIPWGPIYSIQCIATNLRGGKDITDHFVDQLI